MATRAMQSSAPVSTSTRGTITTGLPPYEQPQFNPNPDAQRALSALTRKHELVTLDTMIKEAQATIINCAAEINERLAENTSSHNKRKARVESSQSGLVDGEEDAEKNLERFKDKVEKMTQRMDDAMRRLIDGQHSVQHIRESATAVHEDARTNASTQASTQNLRSQARRNRDGQDDVEGDNEEDYREITPTDPAGATQAIYKPTEMFKRTLEDRKTRYENVDMAGRYGENENYVNFRRLVHSARHPEDDVELGPPSQWFGARGQPPEPGITPGDDSDDDIQISRATTSTKCPITLQEFKEPLTSKSCPHSFEAAAILEMISRSENRVGARPGARGGTRAVQCPVQSCDKMLTKEDLYKDNVIAYKIKRLQRARELQAQDAEMDGDRHGRGSHGVTELIDDDQDDAADVDDFDDRPPPVKPEPKSTGVARATQRSPTPDLEDEDRYTSDDGINYDED